MMSVPTQQPNSLFNTTGDYNVVPPHSMATVHPYQQFGIQPTGYPMVPPQLNYHYPPQPPVGHYPGYFNGPYIKNNYPILGSYFYYISVWKILNELMAFFFCSNSTWV